MYIKNNKIGTLLLAACLLAVSPVYAGKISGTMTASATVKEVVSATTVYQLPSVQISREDIDRGYVDVRDATVMEIRTNSRKGYYLAFEGGAGPFSAIAVLERGRTTLLADGKGMVHQAAGQGLKGEQKALSYRFYLAGDAKPGVYAFPMAVSVAFD
ncbi:MAG: hypothetical protein A2V90_04345 [Gammaproteobacteria bacterium RBG_16_57_12]|nr:MAG: hypothetical protein A2V90_04345 [Gammaproteobacteria bacterium RBG_16_57_12]